MTKQPILFPFGRTSSSWDEVNKYGAVIFGALNKEDQNFTQSFTQVFKTGEIWGIDKEILDNGHGSGYFASEAIENVFNNAFGNYLSFAEKNIKLNFPIRVIGGVSGVENFGITISSSQMGGNCVEDEVVYEGVINSFESKPAEFLKPFFRNIWESCGLEYPKSEE